MKKIMLRVLSFFLSTLFFHLNSEWTWCFRKKYVDQLLEDGNKAFIKTNIPFFNQLIFSWNALKPRKGTLVFWVKVRYADTRKWSDWQQMAEWSESGGKTFYGKHPDGLEYCYVRLQLPSQRYADAFHIKVSAHRNALLSDVKMLTVCVSDLQRFNEEVASSYAFNKTHYIEKVPAWSQMTLDHPKCKSLCSPTALCGLVSYLNNTLYEPLDFAEGVYDYGLRIHGSWPCNTAYAFCASERGAFFHVQRLENFNSLLECLEKNIPVVVSVRGNLAGAPKSYPNGHLILVVGYNGVTKKVICKDSAVVSGSTLREYPLASFLKCWEASHRLSYIASW